MITILPLKDNQKADDIRTKNDIPDSATILAMQDHEEILGFSVVEIENSTISILKLNAADYNFVQKPTAEQNFILDSLIRSSASYGENFGVKKIQTSFPDFFDFMKVRGFSVDETHTYTDISTLVKYK